MGQEYIPFGIYKKEKNLHVCCRIDNMVYKEHVTSILKS